jgi:hypothetical protein
MTSMPETIIVAGSLAQRPRHGGHTWVFLQYLLGFARLGYDVHFIDRLAAGVCVDDSVRFLRGVMERVGLADRWTLLHGEGGEAAGAPRAVALERTRRATMMLNVMGFLDDEELMAAARLRVFLDIDPGFGQMWHALDLARPFEGHDRHVTVGGQVGRPGCAVPACGLDWVTTLPPVELSEWPAAGSPAHERFTSIVSWRGPFGPIEYGGRTYGLRVHEFRRFLDLPQRTGAAFELALDIDDADERDRASLVEHGWRLADPIAAAGDPWRYRRYVQGSAAELMIAKNLYVDTRSGWFSDRTACYLASGRPALVQDTGLGDLLPVGEGLLAFSTPEEAVDGVAQIQADPERHRRAARALAEEHLAAARVLPRLLERLGVG